MSYNLIKNVWYPLNIFEYAYICRAFWVPSCDIND